MNVDVVRREGIVEITLDRPDKRNAMTDAMWNRLDEILQGVDAGGRDRVLVVTGAGGAFCGGSDVGGLLNDLDSLPDRIAVSNRCVLAMRELGLPTIAKVSGVAAGSGANLALACDFVVADERARFAQPLPLAEGFDAIEAHLKRFGRPTTAFCACELRSPGQYTDAGFIAFNRHYVQRLEAWGLFRDDGGRVVDGGHHLLRAGARRHEREGEECGGEEASANGIESGHERDLQR